VRGRQLCLWSKAQAKSAKTGEETLEKNKTLGFSDSGGASGSALSVPLPLTLPGCECPCHKNGGEPYSCGAMCWHPQLDADEYIVELAHSTNNIDHSVLLLAVYSGGKLRCLVFDPSNGPARRFEVI